MPEIRTQFRYNAYVRFIQISYLDCVYIACKTLFNVRDNTKDIYSPMMILSLMIFSLAIITPFVVMSFLCSNFDRLHKKEERKNYSSLLIKIEKTNRKRVGLPVHYFLRRLVISIILVLSTENLISGSIQYMSLVFFSAITLFYFMTQEPYRTKGLNYYVISLEFIFFLLAVFAFMFTDASQTVKIKQWLSVIILILLWIFLFINVWMTLIFAKSGHEKLKRHFSQTKVLLYQKREL